MDFLKKIFKWSEKKVSSKRVIPALAKRHPGKFEYIVIPKASFSGGEFNVERSWYLFCDKYPIMESIDDYIFGEKMEGGNFFNDLETYSPYHWTRRAFYGSKIPDSFIDIYMSHRDSSTTNIQQLYEFIEHHKQPILTFKSLTEVTEYQNHLIELFNFEIIPISDELILGRYADNLLSTESVNFREDFENQNRPYVYASERYSVMLISVKGKSFYVPMHYSHPVFCSGVRFCETFENARDIIFKDADKQILIVGK